jgi:serine/threonine protein kinase
MYQDKLAPIWSKLSHEHIVPLLGILLNGESLPTFEVPFYKEGNISDYNRRCPDANKLNQIKQIAAGISHMHERDVSHGNICPVRYFVSS